MAARKKSNFKLPKFIPIIRSTIATPAWRAMHHGPRSLYILLTGFVSFDGKNNGSVFVSVRDACEALGTRSHASISRWYDELEHYGFVVKTYAGCLGVDGYGESPHWRLTEWPTQDAKGFHIAPTRDFDRWDGVLYCPRRAAPKTETRYHDEDMASPLRGHREPLPWEAKCPHDEAICSDGEVSSPRGHILFTTPLVSLRPYQVELMEHVAGVVAEQLDSLDARRCLS